MSKFCITEKDLNRVKRDFAQVIKNEGDLYFKSNSTNDNVCLNFHFLPEKSSDNKTRKKQVINKEKLKKLDWTVEENNIYQDTCNVYVQLKTIMDNSWPIMICKFENNKKTINKVLTTIQKLVQEVFDDLSNFRIVLDVSLETRRRIKSKEKQLYNLLKDTFLCELKASKGEFRDFEVIDKRNITTHLNMDNYTKIYSDGDSYKFRVNVENIVTEPNKISDYFTESLYYYYKQYMKLHYQLMLQAIPEFVKQNKEFYNKIKSEYM